MKQELTFWYEIFSELFMRNLDHEKTAASVNKLSRGIVLVHFIKGLTLASCKKSLVSCN